MNGKSDILRWTPAPHRWAGVERHGVLNIGIMVLRCTNVSVAVLGLTKQAPNADKVLRLFRYVFGRYFVCVAQRDGANPHTVPLRVPGATPLSGGHDRLARFWNRALLPERSKALRFGVYRQLRMQE